MSTPTFVTVELYPAVSGFVGLVKALVSTNSVLQLSNNFTTILNAHAVLQTNPFTDVSVTFTGSSITITQAALTSVYVAILVAGVR